MTKATRPTLLLDIDKCKANIQRMAHKAARANVIFRPHFKTHQSRTIGNWYKEFGVDRITCSSLDMASYFSSEWDDILVAIPVNINAIDQINELASRIKLHLLVESIETVQFLADNLQNPVGIYIEVDTGYGRTGIPSPYVEYIADIAAFISQSGKMSNSGLLDHGGHLYSARGVVEIRQMAIQAQQKFNKLAERILPHYPEMNVSTGDTPSCSVMNTFGSATEIRPGNSCFYDLTQNQIGSCDLFDIAVCMACPIIATYPDRGEVIIHGGGVHFSKDTLTHEEYRIIYGLVVDPEDWSQTLAGCYVSKLSQEHGTVKVNLPLSYKLKVGDTLYILPVHSCLTSDAMPCYWTTTGEKIEKWNGEI